MISPTFYRKSNIVNNNLRSQVSHYAQKPKIVVTETSDYVMKAGETFYDLAVQLFGQNRQYMWTIIADINKPRKPDEWEEGDKVKLPLTIVQESAFNR